MKTIFKISLVVISLTTCVHVNLKAQTGLELMQKNNSQISSNDEQVDLTMELVNSKNMKRTRSIKLYSITDNNNNESTLIQFLAPADVKGTGFLEIENSDREDDQWLYLPALNRSRRISANNETDNFMGSDFTYEDIGNENLDNFNYKKTGEETINGVNCFVVEATPKNEDIQKQSGYQKRELFICKETYILTKVKYYNKKGELFKVLHASDIKTIGSTGKFRAHTIVMENLKTQHKTNLLFSNYSIDSGMNKEFFSKRYLEGGI
jgi:hypothetical protein